MVEIQGDILRSEKALIAIPVNCVGVAGAGLAKQWRDRFPKEHQEYRRLCSEGKLRPGKPVIVGKFILFPTKLHWRNPSRLEWIEEGLKYLRDTLQTKGEEIALPPLGCGLGGLQWSKVRKLIATYLPEATVYYRV